MRLCKKVCSLAWVIDQAEFVIKLRLSHQARLSVQIVIARHKLHTCALLHHLAVASYIIFDIAGLVLSLVGSFIDTLLGAI